MNQVAVDMREIRKSYNGTRALNDISVHIHQGELFGFIGPDGAGKSTLFHILTTLLLPDAGTALVGGFDTVREYGKIRRIVGYMPGRFSLYQDLTVEENLKFFAGIFKTTIAENYHLIKDIYGQIEPFKNRRAGQLSGGMKQKLALSCALVHKPEILFLDEPTTGVDAVSRKEFWEMLQRLKAQGITIIVSTPYMDEAALCDRVALMQKGDFMAINTPEVIVANFGYRLFAVKSALMYPLPAALEAMPDTKAVYRFGDAVHYLNTHEDKSAEDIIRHLQVHGHNEVTVNQVNPTIEDCFMLLMKKEETADANT
ncbi:MAG: ABC transporter ATP-binding protein [Bacteroidetes bacterium]|nr:ABC transporter ATP-binding protein [Bacteroidales bacterium]MBU1008693.1 ABC transporter ATP-binding protein [Bacteroidota bacterium]